MINSEPWWIIDYDPNRDEFLIRESNSDVVIIVTMLDLVDQPFNPFIKVIDEYQKRKANIRRDLDISSSGNNIKMLGKG